jgi:hypothetical protein
VPLLPTNVDYTDRDFDSLRARLVALIQSAFPDWTDFDAASFGTILLECFAFVGDTLGFYIDAQGREARLATATQRRNVLALARMLGYAPRSARAAVTDLEITLADAPRADVAIPVGRAVRTDGASPVRFQTADAAIIAAGASPATARVRVEHSTSYTQRFDVSPPRIWLELELDRAPYLDGSAEVSTTAGNFVEVPTLVASGPNDRHFAVVVDQSDRATLRFGDGRTGAVPSGTIRVDYRTGGGRVGNVDSNTLTILEEPLVDARGTPVRASVRNPSRAEGGADRESIAEIRDRAPLALRAPSRSVSREDFEIHAREVPGVARALMLTSNEDLAIEENSGVLYVVPDGGGVPTPALLDAVRRQMRDVYPSTLTFELRVQEPVYRVVNVVARVSLRRGASPGATASTIRSRLAATFAITRDDGTANPTIDFGYYARRSLREPVGAATSGDFDGVLAWSDVFDVVDRSDGVRKIASWDLLLNGAAQDVRLRPEELPVLGAVVLYDASNGALLG